MFQNNKLRIGVPAVNKDNFIVEKSNGRTRKGRREDIPQYIAEMGFSAYEYAGGRVASLKYKKALDLLRKNAEYNDIALSIHAPYYVSLTSEDPATRERSIQRLANVYLWCTWFGAPRFVLHPGSAKPKDALSLAVEHIKESRALFASQNPKLKSKLNQICCCVETMGKHGQLGTLEEVITICKDVGLSKTRPCIDWGHLYAYTLGKGESAALYTSTLDKIESELGKNIVESLHMHYSKIEYGEKGELRHVLNDDKKYGPEFSPLIEIIRDNGYTPIIINESPELERDAMKLLEIQQNVYSA